MNLNKFKISSKSFNHFSKSFNYLPFDPYINDFTRQRRFANYNVNFLDTELNNNCINENILINYTGSHFFRQNVNDSRNNLRKFSLIHQPYDIFLVNFIKQTLSHLRNKTGHKRFNINVHQVRQIAYPNRTSSNSPEGIHKDGCDFVVPALVLNRYNINGGISYVYTENKRELYNKILNKNEFILMNDRNLYHHVSPIQFHPNNDIYKNEGYRDILGLDINIDL